jgi:hypothetical protein
MDKADLMSVSKSLHSRVVIDSFKKHSNKTRISGTNVMILEKKSQKVGKKLPFFYKTQEDYAKNG